MRCRHTPKHSYAGKLAFPVDTPITVEALLTHYMDIVGPVPLAMLRALASASDDSAQSSQLTALSDADTYAAVVGVALACSRLQPVALRV